MKSSTWSSVFVLAVGVFALLFLVAIDRQNWFHIRPATGTAAALSQATDRAAESRTAQANDGAPDQRFSRG